MAPVLGLTAIILVVRFTQIHQSLMGDEVFTYHDIVNHSFSSLLSGIHTGGENSPPLFFLAAWVTAKLGDPTVWIRLPSIVLGAATIPLIYLLGRDAVGRVPALVGAAIFSVSPFSLYYGVEARPYAMMVFFVAASTYALLRAVRSGSPRWWILYTVASAGAAYSHYTSVFVLGVQAVWSLWVCRDRLRVPLIANALIVLLYVPWIPNIRGKALDVIGTLEKLTTGHVFVDLAKVIAGYPYAPLSKIPTYIALGAMGAALLVGLWWLFAGRAWERWEPEVKLLCALTVATPIGLLLYSLLVTDLWLARGLYASAPAAVLMLGAVLTRPPRRVATVAVLIVLAGLLFGMIRALTPAYVRGPFRAVASDLDRLAGPREPISFGSISGFPAITAQLKKPHFIAYTGASALQAARQANGRLFVVIDDFFARGFHIVGAPAMTGFRPVGHKHYPGLFPTDVWIYRARK